MEVWDSSLYLLFILWFSAMLRHGVPGLHDGGCVGQLPLLVIYFMVFSHATGTVSLAYMMVDVWDSSLYLLFILWFYGDGVPGLHDGGGRAGLLTLLVIYFMFFSHATGTVFLAYMMVDVWDCSLYLLFILWFSAMLRARCPWPT